MDIYIIQAKCIFSNYTDVFKVNADSATDAIEIWTNQQARIGITTEYRWPNPKACKLEHFRTDFVYTDNLPANMAKSGHNANDHEVVSMSELSSSERQEVLEYAQWERNFERNFKEDYPDGSPF